MEHRLLYDTFVIGSLLVMLQSDCLPVPAKTAKPNDGEWWGVIGSVFVLSISEFKWILRFKIQVRLFYHLQAPHGDNFELFVFVPKKICLAAILQETEQNAIWQPNNSRNLAYVDNIYLLQTNKNTLLWCNLDIQIKSFFTSFMFADLQTPKICICVFIFW